MLRKLSLALLLLAGSGGYGFVASHDLQYADGLPLGKRCHQGLMAGYFGFEFGGGAGWHGDDDGRGATQLDRLFGAFPDGR